MDFSDLGGTPVQEAGIDFSDLGGTSVKESPSVGGFFRNAGRDIADTAKGTAGMLKGTAGAALDMLKAPVNPAPFAEDLLKGKQALEAVPGAIVNEGKRIGFDKLLAGHPIDAQKKGLQAFYDKPLTSLLDVAPFIPGAGEASVAEKAELPINDVSRIAPKSPAPIDLGNEAASVIKSAAEKIPADDVSRLAPKAAPPIDLGEEAASAIKPTPKPAEVPEPPKSSFESLAQEAKSKIPKSVLDPMDQVKNYLAKEYGTVANKPGIANTVADYLEEHSNNMALKDLGAAPGQIRKLGIDKAREIAEYAKDNGLVGPKIGTIGREKLIPQRLEDAGGAVGAFRKMAADRGAVLKPQDLVNQIRSNLDQKYLTPGMYSGQKGTYLKALQEIQKTDGTAQAISDKVTQMFKEAKNQNPLSKPIGPLADVAGQARQLNHQNISKFLSPQEMALYEKSLEDYGALTQLNEFVKRRASVEAGGRLGPGSGISRAAVQKFLDTFGYRTQAKVADKLAEFIRTNPDVVKRPTDLFRRYIDESADAVHEMGETHQ